MATSTLETYGDLINEVRNYGFAEGPQVNVNRIEKWINEAQRMVARHVEAPEFQAKETIALTKGTYRYTLPTGFLRMESCYLPAMQVSLRPVDQKTFDRNSPIVEGPPLIYTLRENEIWLYPTPISTEKGVETPAGEAEGLEMRFYKAPTILKAEADVPTMKTEYLHVLVDYALWRAFGAEDDSEQAQFHENVYKRALDEYASDVQRRDVDRPRMIDGTWGSGTYGQGGWY